MSRKSSGPSDHAIGAFAVSSPADTSKHFRLEAIATRVEAIATRLDAMLSFLLLRLLSSKTRYKFMSKGSVERMLGCFGISLP